MLPFCISYRFLAWGDKKSLLPLPCRTTFHTFAETCRMSQVCVLAILMQSKSIS